MGAIGRCTTRAQFAESRPFAAPVSKFASLRYGSARLALSRAFAWRSTRYPIAKANRRVPPPRRLTDLQLAIMEKLWDYGEASIAQVHQALRPERPLALSTVATVLQRMHKKQWLRRRSRGRQYVFRPNITFDEVRNREVEDLARRMFGSRVQSLAEHLVVSGKLSVEEVEQLCKQLRRVSDSTRTVS